MRTALLATGLAFLATLLPLSAAEQAKDKEPAKKMEWKGTLRTGVVAIGGETTGTVLETKDGKFELDLGKNKELRDRAAKLSGKPVIVTGTLTVRKGVEVKERRIIAVSDLKAADAK